MRLSFLAAGCRSSADRVDRVTATVSKSDRSEAERSCALSRAIGRLRGVGRALPLVSAALLGSGGARAAGFDTPVLYTARHQGMGGAAIGYVDDPSAAFHNPAGLQGVKGLALLGDVSLLLAHLTGSPAASASASGIQSQLVVAPFFMAAGAYRVMPWLSAGLAVFPVASGGAEYEYAVPGRQQNELNATSLVFYEVTPLISLNVPDDLIVPGRLSFGVGYRASLATFGRQQGEPDDPRVLDLDLSGSNFVGFRAGLQYRPNEAVSLGAVYRSRITVTTRADQATVLGQVATGVELPFVLPAQLGGGLRADVQRLGVAFDALYTFQSQNDREVLTGLLGQSRAQVPNVFDWRDGFTLRFGFEYRLGPAEQVPIRVGYVYDEQVANRAYPSAFGTPPAPTRAFTLGGGYDAGSWEMNLALALRGGGTEVRPSDLAGPGDCPTCGFSGEYEISATGLYVDVSTDLEL